MAITDPVADGLTILRNANHAKKDKAEIKASKLLADILKILKEEKFIYDFRRIEDNKQGLLRVYLKKTNERMRKITKIMRVSKPGLRVYAQKDSIPTVLNGFGICILSTPQGVLTGEQAKMRGVGGEVLLKVW